jgi:hypothetical protein
MEILKTTGRLLAPLLCVTSLVGCGGGGGGDGLAAGTAAITTQNAQTIARLVVGGSGTAEEVNHLIDDIMSEFDFTQSGTFPCGVGGSVTVSFVANSPVGEPVAGDSFTITFNACVIDIGGGPGQINGTLSAVVVRASASALTITFTLGSLTFTVRGETTTANGDMTIEIRDLGGNLFTVIVRGNALNVEAGAESSSLENYRFETTADLFTGEFTSTQSGTLRDSALGGTVTFRTTDPFEGTAPGNPDRGRMRINGADGSVVFLTILDRVNILVEVDEDGDGVFDDTFQTTWAALDN